MKRAATALLFLAGVGFSQPAWAFCYQGRDIDGALQYLICLHNEQNDSINDLSNTLSSNARISNSNHDLLVSKISDLESQLSTLEGEVDTLRRTVRDLESRIP
jgi:TolA-binding protein